MRKIITRNMLFNILWEFDRIKNNRKIKSNEKSSLLEFISFFKTKLKQKINFKKELMKSKGI